MKPDPELLEDYLRRRSEAAFTALVQRHLPLVHGVALRQVNGDSQLAQDVAQACFIALARQADQLIDRPSLAGWLHSTSLFLASKTVRQEVRRRARETNAVAMQEISPPPEINWSLLEPVLDETMQELPEPDREAVLLRFFKSQDYKTVGLTLGLSEEAARKRVDRAVTKLRVLLQQRGLHAASDAALVAALAGTAVCVSPAALATTIAQTALAATATAGIAAAGALNLSPLKIAAILALGGALTAGILRERSLRLHSERERAALVTNLAAMQAAAGQTGSNAISSRERAFLEAEHRQAIEMRAQLARLRMAANTTTNILNELAVASPSSSASNPPPPLSYSTAFTNSVPVGASSLAGGWTLANGKRLLLLLTPEVDSNPQSGSNTAVTISTRWIEMPRSLSQSPDLFELMTNQAAGANITLTPGQVRDLIDNSEKGLGVNLLTAPKVTTLNGRPARISVSEGQRVNERGETEDTGVIVNITSNLSEDRSSFELQVDAMYTPVENLDAASPDQTQ